MLRTGPFSRAPRLLPGAFFATACLALPPVPSPGRSPRSRAHPGRASSSTWPYRRLPAY